MSKKDGTAGHTSPRVRDAGTGQFVPAESAKTRPGTTVTERIPHPGWGQESSTPIGRDAGSGRFVPVEEAKGKDNAVVTRVPKKS